jgi:hypothetical protein
MLILISAAKSRRSGEWSPDDYDVRDGAADGPVVGRIYLSPARQQDPWFWGLTLFRPRPRIVGSRRRAKRRRRS